MDERAIGLVSWLRVAGLDVPVSATIAFAEALALLGDDLESVRWAGLCTLTASPADVELFDLVFRRWILGEGLSEVAVPRDEPVTLEHSDDDGSDEGDDADRDDDRDRRSIRSSRIEVLADRDLATLGDDELAEIDRLIARLRPAPSTRRSRRRRPGARGDRPDLRRTVRAALRTDGEPMVLHARSRIERPRRLVLLVDISGSMASYGRALVRFAHASVMARDDVEVFALGTRLTRLTRELDTHDPDLALERAMRSIDDWSGGTRLGEGLASFNDRWGTRGVARGANVVVLSDGWDRGEPAVMAEQMARLSRVAHRIIWVNPLKASPGYEPLARGMAAALPYVDEFVEGHSFASLERLAELVASVGTDRRPTPAPTGAPR